MPQLPPMTQHDYAYFDYIEGLKVCNYKHHVKTILKEYDEKATRFQQDKGYMPSTMSEAGELIAGDLLYQFACGIQRTSQLLMWAAGIDSLKPHQEKLLAIMDERMPAKPLGGLELHPEMKLPSWYTENDIHLNPGGYWGDELVGAVYQRSAAAYRTAWRRGIDSGELMAFARSAPQRNYRRILDMGCAFGRSTMGFRHAYPEAEEVVGIDLSANALKWGHLTAEEQGLRITLAQRDTSDTRYPSESFDLVTGYLLLHEMPPNVLDETVREAFRLLCPGGHIMFMDVPRYGVLPPQVAFLEDFDTWGNGEPFWGPFLSRDFPAVLRGAGFVNVHEGPLDYDDGGSPGVAALMRTGELHIDNRWITRADKPVAEGRAGNGRRTSARRK